MDAFQNLERWLHRLHCNFGHHGHVWNAPFRSVPNAPAIVKECRLCWQLARLWDRNYIIKRSRQGYYKRSLQLKRSCQTEDASQPHHFIVHIKCTGMQWFCSRKIQHLLSELLKKLIFIRESGADGQSHCDGESAARGRGWCGEAQSVSSRPSCKTKRRAPEWFFSELLLRFLVSWSELRRSMSDDQICKPRGRSPRGGRSAFTSDGSMGSSLCALTLPSLSWTCLHTAPRPPSPLPFKAMPRPLKHHALGEFSYSYLIIRHGNNSNKVKWIIDLDNLYKATC